LSSRIFLQYAQMGRKPTAFRHAFGKQVVQRLPDRVLAWLSHALRRHVVQGQERVVRVHQEHRLVRRVGDRAGEAYLRLGRVADAKDVLLKIDELVERRRPPASASSNQKANHASEAARFWQMRGMVAEADGRALDALVAYRNAVTTYPPRSPRGDRRDEAMQAVARLWQRLGGTTQGWSDGSSSSSFANFNAGAGTSNAAWARLGNAFPKLVLTDSLGHQWVPQDLAKKTVFVTVWANWCGPCRAELPYVQRLYERFRGRDDVAVPALNVDDDPKLTDVTLGQLQVTLPSIAARDFAYSLLPVMALPSNWLLTPSRTEEVTPSEPTLAVPRPERGQWPPLVRVPPPTPLAKQRHLARQSPPREARLYPALVGGPGAPRGRAV
jgi:thiol-disulfide isomerase/thioredoxin